MKQSIQKLLLVLFFSMIFNSKSQEFQPYTTTVSQEKEQLELKSATEGFVDKSDFHRVDNLEETFNGIPVERKSNLHINEEPIYSAKSLAYRKRNNKAPKFFRVSTSGSVERKKDGELDETPIIVSGSKTEKVGGKDVEKFSVSTKFPNKSKQNSSQSKKRSEVSAKKSANKSVKGSEDEINEKKKTDQMNSNYKVTTGSSAKQQKKEDSPHREKSKNSYKKVSTNGKPIDSDSTTPIVIDETDSKKQYKKVITSGLEKEAQKRKAHLESKQKYKKIGTSGVIKDEETKQTNEEEEKTQKNMVKKQYKKIGTSGIDTKKTRETPDISDISDTLTQKNKRTKRIDENPTDENKSKSQKKQVYKKIGTSGIIDESKKKEDIKEDPSAEIKSIKEIEISGRSVIDKKREAPTKKISKKEFKQIITSGLFHSQSKKSFPAKISKKEEQSKPIRYKKLSTTGSITSLKSKNEDLKQKTYLKSKKEVDSNSSEKANESKRINIDFDNEVIEEDKKEENLNKFDYGKVEYVKDISEVSKANLRASDNREYEELTSDGYETPKIYHPLYSNHLTNVEVRKKYFS